jgi:hypothetical protein
MGSKPKRTASRKMAGKPDTRNPVVRNATILRKGGAHGKTQKAERQDRKIQLKREIRQDRESPFLFLLTAQVFATR